MASKQPDKKDLPGYLIMTQIEELIDDGLTFEGDDEKTRQMNMTDFLRIRELIQRFGSQVTADTHDTLLRTLKTCIKQKD